VILPGLVGAALLWRRRGGDAVSRLLPIWTVLPIALYSLSSARSARYLFPIFPALALCSGDWLGGSFPRFTAALRRWVAPAVALLAAAVFWLRPTLLAASGTAFFKEDTVIESRVPGTEPLTYLGSWADYWGLANPLLYYTERQLEAPSESLAAATDAAVRRRSGLILVQRNRLHELQGREYAVVLERPEWLLVRPDFDRGRSSD
jgi:4-amino-4-deoxy-L-arabinose transferase-like glycosyltransferase